MLTDKQVLQLDGLPSHWRYTMTGADGDAKRCFETGWNEPGHGYTLDQVIRLNETPSQNERWKSRKMVGLGAITGEESNGLLVIDFDGTGSEAVRAFRRHFRRFPSELPPTAMNISGKVGRAKCFYQVPPHWWPQLEGVSASWRNANDDVILEGIWNNTTARGRHAVITGDHPQTSHQKPLWYRWVEGFSPAETPVAVAPDWLLEGIITQSKTVRDRTVQERRRSGEDDATPWERLSAYERRELVELALPHCPNREGRSSGTYEKVRRILCGILNEFGLEWSTDIVARSAWDKGNQWEPGNDTAKVLASLAKSKVSEDQKARIGTLFFFAREGKWEPPTWAIPPVEMRAQVEGFRKLLNQFNEVQNDSVAMAAFVGRAKREYGVEADTLRRLALEQHLGGVERTRPTALPDVANNAHKSNIETDVLDGFLGRRVHVIAGASHSGKTTLASFLTNRVITGAPIDVDGTRHCTQGTGRVLIFTSDCSDQDMVRDLALEGVNADNAKDNLLICSGTGFDDMLRICQLLEEFAPDLVIYDCLTSMACADVRIGDPSYADPIRLLVRHNGLAWPKCAHVILHHTTRDEPTRFSGTEQIKAAAEELWLYYPPELLKWKKGQPRPAVGFTRHLVMEKSRSGYAGRVLNLTRNPYQGHWQFHRPDIDATSAMDALAHRFRAVEHDRWQIASQWAKELDLAFNPRSLRRYLDQMVGTVLEVDKCRSIVTGRLDTHYRPRDVIRDAAKAMSFGKGDGVNEL